MAVGLVLLIGLPGSGKSAWAAEALARAERPTVVVSTDALVEAQARGAGVSYREAWAAADGRRLERDARAAVRASVEAGCNVIVDRTNLKRATRARFLRLAPPGWRREAVLFAPPWPLLCDRLAARAASGGKRVPCGVVLAMAAGYEAPGEGEFDRLILHSG